MPSNASLESLSTAHSYFTAHESHTAPPPSTALFGNAGPSFHTTNISGGNIINVAGDYHATTEGPTVTYPPDCANYAPTGTITRHFVGRTDELLQIHRAFHSLREANHPIRHALFGAAGIGKSQLALQYAESAYAQDRYSHVFYISAASADHIREGLAHMLRLLQPSDYVCAPSVAAHEARRWLEDAQPDIAWLLIVDDVVLDSVDYLRTYLPRRNRGGDIIFVAQSRVVAEALADEGPNAISEVGPLARDDAVQLLFKKAGAKESSETIEEARSIVEQLDRLPVLIRQAASFARHFQSKLGSLTRLLQEGQLMTLSRWDTRLTGYEYTTFASVVQAQLARLASDRPQAAELLKVLCYLHPSGISLPILIDGARLLRSAPTKTSKLPQFMSKSRRPKFLPSDLDHPLSTLLSTIALQDELHNLVRCLQHISLVRLETDRPTDVASNAETLKGQSSHILRIPDLVRKIVRGEKGRKDEEGACFGVAVGIIVSAFAQRRHDTSLRSPFIKHLTSLSQWDWEFIGDRPQGRLHATCRAALNRAIQILAEFDKKRELERKLKTDGQVLELQIKRSFEQYGF